MQTIRVLNRFFAPYKQKMFLGIITVVMSSLFFIGIPYFIRQMIDNIYGIAENSSSLMNESIIHILFYTSEGKELGLSLLILIGLSMLSGLSTVFTRQTMIVTSHKIVYDIRLKIFNKLLVIPQKFYDKYGVANIYVRITEDVDILRSYYGPITMYAFNIICRTTIIISAMLVANVNLTLWSLSIFPFIALFAFFTSHYIYHVAKRVQEKYSDLVSTVQDVFSNILISKAYSLENYNEEKFYKVSENYKREKLTLELIQSFFRPTVTFFLGIILTIIIWYGGKQVILGVLSLGNIAEFIIYILSLTWPFVSLGGIISQYQKSKASWARIKGILEYEEEQPVKFEKISDRLVAQVRADIQKHGIEFDRISFVFPGSDKFVLRNINFSIKYGQSIGIVGKVGSGKSALIQLLMGFYKPTSGRIMVGGINIENIKPNVLRRVMSCVFQDHFLFSTSIRKNIMVSHDGITDAEIEKVSQEAGLYDNIIQFEKKFDTLLGERGVNLSGGQKQRLSIARSLANPWAETYIFDDSFSAIDNITEKHILKSIRSYYSDKIHIFITHRISTIIHCDKILLMNHGLIESVGTHKELITQNTFYADMYRQQFSEYEPEVKKH